MSRKANTRIKIIDEETKTNTLKIKLDDLKTFQPLTENQKKFFEGYKRGDYFVALHEIGRAHV